MFQLSRRAYRLDSVSEEKLFEYFQDSIAPRLASYRPLQLDLAFWQTLVPKLAIEHPPIRHAMLALAATVEKFEARYENVDMQALSSGDAYFALEQYTEVLEKLNSGISAATLSVEATLICCLLLTLCDLWHFGLPLSFKHVFGGLGLCKVIKKTSPSKSPLPEATEIEGKVMLPAYLHFADTALVELDNPNDEELVLLQEFGERLGPIVPPPLTNLEETYAVMDKVIRQIAKLEPGVTPGPIVDIGRHLSMLLLTCENNFGGFESDVLADRQLLKVHHRAALVMLHVITTGAESAYDQHTADFDFIVSEIEELLYSEEQRTWFGLIPPLFLVATRCHDQQLSHRALRVLHGAHQLERFWTSCTAYQIAKETLRLQANAAPHHGIRLNSILFDPENSEIKLGYSSTQAGPQSSNTSIIAWQPDQDSIYAVHNREAYYMPANILKVSGYTSLMLAFRRDGCHCAGAG